MKQPTVSKKAMDEVYLAFKILLEKHPNGIGPVVVHRELLTDVYSVSYVSRTAQYLETLGCLTTKAIQSIPISSVQQSWI